MNVFSYCTNLPYPLCFLSPWKSPLLVVARTSGECLPERLYSSCGWCVMQLGHVLHGQKCARCRQPLQSDPACDGVLWYHRPCLEEGQRALQHAEELAARFRSVPVDAHTAEE